MGQTKPLTPKQKFLVLVTMVLLNTPMFAWLWYWGVHLNYFSRGLGPPYFAVIGFANILIGIPLTYLIMVKWIRTR